MVEGFGFLSLCCPKVWRHASAWQSKDQYPCFSLILSTPMFLSSSLPCSVCNYDELSCLIQIRLIHSPGTSHWRFTLLTSRKLMTFPWGTFDCIPFKATFFLSTSIVRAPQTSCFQNKTQDSWYPTVPPHSTRISLTCSSVPELLPVCGHCYMDPGKAYQFPVFCTRKLVENTLSNGMVMWHDQENGFIISNKLSLFSQKKM